MVKAPKKVRHALKLLYIALGLSLLQVLMTGALLKIWATFFILIVYGLVIWLYYFIGKGHNWARIVFTVLSVLGMPAALYDGLTALTTNILNATHAALQILISVVALVWFFQPDSNAWFSKKRTGRS